MANGYDLRIIQPMSVPVATMLCRLAKIRSIINNTVYWNEANAQISPGLLVETLIICILYDRKPLWKVCEFWQNQDLTHLFPDDNIQSEWLNDDAYGHALDKVAEVNMELVISLVCLVLLEAHNVGIDRVHLDTTSKSVQGIYNGATSICFGHSKDLRPDLKQIKFGIGVQQDGLPVAGEVLSGNTSDVKWNIDAAGAMKDFFDNHRYKDILFVSDCAIVSTDNLKTLSEKKIQFVSRLPETFNLAERLKEEAFKENKWLKAGNLTKDKTTKGAQYQLYSKTTDLDGRLYRFIVVQSSALLDHHR